ncbi:unnamed protein product [Linum tenue]|uniref:Uncharacterized protein n=1 Tax=Linum tenue TaxID=586396 RepID=A0AAV0RGK0_9ROSI|nr:unnamed protein product [Linum tenue]
MGKGRAPCCDKNQVKRGPWSPAEDLRLMTFIQKYGHENWRSLPKQAGLSRCGKSCRLRWINYLRPDVKRGNFTPEEEDSIIRLHRELGNKWSKIASHLPGRTDNEIKNVWNTHLKKRVSSSNKKNVELISKLSSPTSSSSSSTFSTTTTSSDKRSVQAATIDIDDQQRKRRRTNMLDEEEEDDEVVDKEDIQNNNEDELTNNYEFKSSPNDISNSSVSSILTDSCSLIDNVVSMDSIFSLGESVGNVYDVLEDVSRPGVEDFTLEIPLESDMEFWNLLDGLTEPNGNNGENVASLSDDQLGVQVVDDGEDDDKQKWLRYLETELGLEEINNNITTNQEDNSTIPQVLEEGNMQFLYDDESLPPHESKAQFEENPTSPNQPHTQDI